MCRNAQTAADTGRNPCSTTRLAAWAGPIGTLHLAYDDPVMRRLSALILTATAGALVGVLILAARALPPSPAPFLGSAPADFRPPPGALERLAAAIRVPTVSRDYPATAPAFDALHELLREAFPRVHATLRQERVAGHTLLYTWHGRDASAPALLLLAHQDVVPVDDERLPHWQQPPFDGVNADGYLWGRGTLDDKSSLMAQLEAAEALLGDAFVPPQTIYLVFGYIRKFFDRLIRLCYQTL